jgi:hypothetical protein
MQKLYENPGESLSGRSLASYVLAFLVGSGLGALGGHGSVDVAERLAQTLWQKGVNITISLSGARSVISRFFGFFRMSSFREMFKAATDLLGKIRKIISDIIYFHGEAIKEFGAEIANGNVTSALTSIFLVPVAERVIDGMFALWDQVKDWDRRDYPGLGELQ